MWGLKIPAFFSTGFGDLLKVKNNETLHGPKVYYILVMIFIGMNRIGTVPGRKVKFRFIYIYYIYSPFFLTGGKDEYLNKMSLRMNI